MPAGPVRLECAPKLRRAAALTPAYLGTEHDEPLRTAGAELGVGGSRAPFGNPQHGAVVRHGAGLWLAHLGQRRHEGRVAAQGSLPWAMRGTTVVESPA